MSRPDRVSSFYRSPFQSISPHTACPPLARLDFPYCYSKIENGTEYTRSKALPGSSLISRRGFMRKRIAALCTAFGQSVPSGTLPVNVPKVSENEGETVFEEELLYERGFGLQNWGN
jgi:hypothetical protein